MACPKTNRPTSQMKRAQMDASQSTRCSFSDRLPSFPAEHRVVVTLSQSREKQPHCDLLPYVIPGHGTLNPMCARCEHYTTSRTTCGVMRAINCFRGAISILPRILLSEAEMREPVATSDRFGSMKHSSVPMTAFTGKLPGLLGGTAPTCDRYEARLRGWSYEVRVTRCRCPQPRKRPTFGMRRRRSEASELRRNVAAAPDTIAHGVGRCGLRKPPTTGTRIRMWTRYVP